jgi:hypothetical protein
MIDDCKKTLTEPFLSEVTITYAVPKTFSPKGPAVVLLLSPLVPELVLVLFSAPVHRPRETWPLAPIAYRYGQASRHALRFKTTSFGRELA